MVNDFDKQKKSVQNATINNKSKCQHLLLPPILVHVITPKIGIRLQYMIQEFTNFKSLNLPNFLHDSANITYLIFILQIIQDYLTSILLAFSVRD